jgi:tetratricopeptide (TPR) repeat protein
MKNIQPSHDSAPPICRRLLALAERNPQRAMPLARRALENTPAEDPALRAWAAYTLGSVLLRQERAAEAEPIFQQAYIAFTALGMSIPALDAEYGQLATRQLRSSDAELQTAWAALAAAYTAHGRHLGAARVRLQQIGHLNVLGLPHAALALVNQIAALFEQHGEPFDQAWLLRLTGVAYGNMGKLDQAGAYLEQAADRFLALKQPAEVAKTWFEIAWINHRREDFVPARMLLERAQALFQQLDLPLRVAFCQKNIGLAASMLGQYDRAIAATLQARTQLVTLGRHDYAAGCDLNLGNIAYYSGLFDLALAAYRRAQVVYEAMGLTRMALISQRNQALVLRAQGQPAQALRILSALVKPVEALGEQLERAEIVHAQGQNLRDLRRYEEALAHFRHAEALFTNLGNAPAAAKSLLGQGWLFLDQLNTRAAAACLQATRPALMDRPTHLWRIDYGLGRCAELEHQPIAALNYYRTASATIARLRQRLASEHASSAIFAQAQQLYDNALRLAVAHNNVFALLEFVEQQRALALQRQIVSHPLAFTADQQTALEQQQSRLRAILADPSAANELDTALGAYTNVLLQVRHHQPFLNDPVVDELDLAALRSAFTRAYPAGWSTLVYIPLDETLLIVRIDAEHLDLTTTPFDARLSQLLEYACLPKYRPFTYLDAPYQRGQTTAPWSHLRELGERLVPATVRAHLHPDMRLLIVAGGLLHNLPWAALRVGQAWLGASAIIQILPGLLLWPMLAQRSPGTDALLIGCGHFAGRAPDLPGIRSVTDQTQALWPGQVTRVEDAAANRQALLAQAANGELRHYGLLQIATHGQLFAARGLLAHLKLADADLFYDDVSRLNLNGALVMLATCDGAIGEVLPGEELLNLSRAFLAAGACDVIASLWQLYDKALLSVLKPLYQALSRGQDAPSALAHAQRSVMAQEAAMADNQSLLSSPLIWASLCAIGAGVATFSSAGGTCPADKQIMPEEP